MIVSSCASRLAATLLAASLIIAPIVASAATFPNAEADTLDGIHVAMPDAARDKAVVLAICVDQKCQGNFLDWSKRLTAAVGARATLYFVVAADGVPFFAKGSVRKSIEKTVPPTPPGEHSHYLLTFSGGGWKTAAGDGPREDPAIVVVAPGGAVAFTKRTPPSEEALAAVLRAIP